MQIIAVPFAQLISTAPALAQSVLDRVLQQVDGAANLAPLNGFFANIAETVPSPEIIPGRAAAVNSITGTGGARPDVN